MSPAWLVVTNPKKVTPLARGGGYSLELQISIQQACGRVAILAPSDRTKCKFSAARHAETGLYTPSQPPPPVRIHDASQAFTWVQKMLAA
eukprot:14103018-Heterocapsa_arctica.AAC.1